MQRKVEFAAEAIVLQLAGAERTVGADLPSTEPASPSSRRLLRVESYWATNLEVPNDQVPLWVMA